MAAIPGFPGLDGLFELDQKGIDIRPILLRVLTDQYVSRRSHAWREDEQYAELALRLLDETDIASRAAVSARLAKYPGAPRSIILQLARDVLEVAEPILKYSACLTPSDCDAIASERGPRYAELIAERGKPPRLESPLPPAADPASASGWSSVPAVAKSTPSAPTTDAQPTELCELFFAAGSAERRLILMTLDYVSADPRAPPSLLQRSDIWRIESAALTHNSGGVVREIEKALGVSGTLARRIVNDEMGEPIVVAAKAMNLPNDVVQRMLLFINPTVGQSVDRVYELAAFYNEISVDAARRLVAIWSDVAETEPAAEPADTPLRWHDMAETARRAQSEVSQPHEREREHDMLSVQQMSPKSKVRRR